MILEFSASEKRFYTAPHATAIRIAGAPLLDPVETSPSVDKWKEDDGGEIEFDEVMRRRDLWDEE